MKFRYRERYHPSLYFVLMIIWTTLTVSMSAASVDGVMTLLRNGKTAMLPLMTPVFISLWVFQLFKKRQASSNPQFIELNKDDMIFISNKELRTVKYDDISKIFSVTLDDTLIANNRQISIITASKQKYDFRQGKFDSKDEYDKFVRYLKCSCKYLS